MITRAAMFVHRWLGAALCLLFLLWFPTGIAMMYWTFPTVTAGDRLERSSALDASSVRLSPVEAAIKAGVDASTTVQTRLNSLDGRPVYRFTQRGATERVVYADSGDLQLEVSRAMVDRAASHWTGQPASAARIESVVDVDQWTVQAPLRTLRPLWKYSWPNGEQVYVSGGSGEVVQYTSTRSRLGAYLGPIPHWFYFTSLRKHQREWTLTVIYSSAAATIAAMLGLVIGAAVYSPWKRYRKGGFAAAVPFRGQKRRHVVFGLVFGIAAVTWAFSGMMSMEPFPLGLEAPISPISAAHLAQTLRPPVSASAFSSRSPRAALELLASQQVKELELTSLAGEPAYIATLAGRRTAVVPVAGAVRAGFDPQRIIDIVSSTAQNAATVETRLIDRYDRYYLDRDRRRPLPVVFLFMDDAERSRYYIDPATARVVGSYSKRDWATRWLYNGLHSLNFPWLYEHRPLWDIVVISFMLGGTALSATAVALTWQLLGRKLRRDC